MKRILKYLLVTVVILAVVAVGTLWFWGQKNLARPAAEAQAALQSTAAIAISEGKWVEFRPTAVTSGTGVIVYPGANCDVRGYAPVLRRLAAAGHLVVAVPMPFNFSIFNPGAADSVRAAYPDISRWVVIGHSMGGAAAGIYAYEHPNELAGLILWDSYPPEFNDLSDRDLNVWHIHRATLDGQPPEKFKAMKHLFPPSSTWVPVPGGIHMYFGAFDGGGYVEEWTPQISREAQLEIVSTATLAAVSAMSAGE